MNKDILNIRTRPLFHQSLTWRLLVGAKWGQTISIRVEKKNLIDDTYEGGEERYSQNSVDDGDNS